MRSVYAANDVFPSAKGAATHIYHASKALFDFAGQGLLAVMGTEDQPLFQQEGNITVMRYCSEHLNYLERSLSFSSWIRDLILRDVEINGAPSIIQFRDPWSGMAMCGLRGASTLVYELNGVPSIELKEFYSSISSLTVEKIRQIESYCLDCADVVVVPSNQIKAYVLSEGISESKVRVVANGAELADTTSAEPGSDGQSSARYFVYFGALQPWQGVEPLIRALALLRDIEDLRIVICSSVSLKHARHFQRLARRLQVESKIEWRESLPKRELGVLIRNALATVAPLICCERNMRQGCCPLKILESMAYGTPVISTRLPVVEELVSHGVDGHLISSERPSEISRAMRLLWDYPEYRKKLGEQASKKIAEKYTWKHNTQCMFRIYSECLISEANTLGAAGCNL